MTTINTHTREGKDTAAKPVVTHSYKWGEGTEYRGASLEVCNHHNPNGVVSQSKQPKHKAS